MVLILKYILVILLLISSGAAAQSTQEISLDYQEQVSVGYSYGYQRINPIGFLGYRSDQTSVSVATPLVDGNWQVNLGHQQEQVVGNLRGQWQAYVGNHTKTGRWPIRDQRWNMGLNATVEQRQGKYGYGVYAHGSVDLEQTFSYTLQPYVALFAGGKWMLGVGGGNHAPYVAVDFKQEAMLVSGVYQQGEVSVSSEYSREDSPFFIGAKWEDKRISGKIGYRF